MQNKPNPIRAARAKAKLTQERLARAVGTTKGAVSSWESGRHSPSPSAALKLCKALPSLSLEKVYRIPVVRPRRTAGKKKKAA